MRLLWLLFVMLPLAGCAQDSGTDLQDGGEVQFVRRGELEFRQPVDLGSKAGVMGSGVGAFGTSCDDSLDDGDCGLGEPTLEVDALGQVYVSGVCCLTVSPPVYVSRDGGESFETLDHPVREAFGIEGDFAIDQAGRVYFSDIEFAGTFQVTVWDHDGEAIRHTKWPAPPLVDRDWIRAEGDGVAYYVYNTGAMGTRVYKTTDAGMTWSPDAIHTVPYALGNVAILPGQELCLFGGSDGGMRRTDCSRDGGASWTMDTSSLANGDDAYPVGAYDENGTLFLGEMQGGDLQYVHRDFGGTWSDPLQITQNGTHRMPWVAAGAPGAVAFAWYGTEDETIDGQTEWYLYFAASRNADSAMPRWDVVRADPDPVFIGELGRDLLDFLQVEVGPDGAVHVAYSDQSPATGPDGNEERLTYVRSEPSLLAATEYFWGPTA